MAHPCTSIFLIQFNDIYLLFSPLFRAMISGLQKTTVLHISFNDLCTALMVGNKNPRETYLSPCKTSKALAIGFIT